MSESIGSDSSEETICAFLSFSDSFTGETEFEEDLEVDVLKDMFTGLSSSLVSPVMGSTKLGNGQVVSSEGTLATDSDVFSVSAWHARWLHCPPQLSITASSVGSGPGGTEGGPCYNF